MLGSLEPTVVNTILSFLEICEDLLPERVEVGRQQSYLTSCYRRLLVGLQSLVCFWKESPPAGVHGVAKSIRDRLEQAADFQCVR